MEKFFRELVARILCSEGRRKRAKRYLSEVLEPALYQTARAWLDGDSGFSGQIGTLNLIYRIYWEDLAGSIERPSLETWRLEIQKGIARKLKIGVGVQRGEPVWFTIPSKDGTDEDGYFVWPPKEEVAR